jgi:hypothetical protein
MFKQLGDCPSKSNNGHDLDRAIEMKELAVEETPDDHPAKPQSLSTLGNSYQLRFEQTQEPDDLERAIQRKEEAVSITGDDDPNRALSLNNSAVSFESRYKRTGSLVDLERAISRNEEAARCVTAPPFIRIRAARAASALLIDRDPIRKKINLYSAVKLLPLVSPRTLAQNDQQYWLSQFTGLTAEATSLSLACGDTPYEALQILELGRGVIASMQIEIRTDISALRAKYPELAARFDYLRDVLDRPQSDIIDARANEAVAQRRDLLEELDNLIRRIRSIDDFSRFLLGPSESELMSIATYGPIIIFNISTIRSDVIIVGKTGFQTLEFSDLSHSESVVQAEAFINAIGKAKVDPVKARGEIKKVLEWLWDDGVNPVFEMMNLVETPTVEKAWPRVWWVGSGLLNVMPIHAAGYHDNRSNNTVIDRVVSSYTPTAQALAYARERASRPSNLAELQVLLVGMAQTPDKSDLRSVDGDLQTLQTQFQQLSVHSVLVNQSPTRPGRFEYIACPLFLPWTVRNRPI